MTFRFFSESIEQTDIFMKRSIHVFQSSSAIKCYNFLLELLTYILLDLGLGTIYISVTSLNVSL